MSEFLVGEVLKAFPDRGYCFIRQEDGSSVFLHVKNVLNQIILSEGDLCAYSVRQNPRKPGLTEAFNARLIKRAHPLPVMPKPEVSNVE